MKKRYYIDKSDINKMLGAIRAQQTRNRVFYNVEVKPYKGKKYDPEKTVVIVIG